MQSLEALSARLRTTGDIHSIVRTMKSLSSASIRQYEHAVETMEDFERTISLGLQIVLGDEGGRIRPDLPGDTRGGCALIVIGSDRGLCGRFNDRIGLFALDRMAGEASGNPRHLCVVGQRVAARLKAAGRAPDTLFLLPGSVGGLVSTVHALAVEVERWTAGDVGTVSILFNRREGMGPGAPTDWQLLPVPCDYLEGLARASWPSRRLPIYRMERGKLLSWLVGQRIFVQLYRALAESLASEHASRLASMQRAERNIGEHREGLMGEFRQKRQEAITRELIDILAGFESVRKTESG